MSTLIEENDITELRIVNTYAELTDTVVNSKETIILPRAMELQLLTK